MTSRRELLRYGMGMLALPALRALAYPLGEGGQGRLVVIFLRGGMDGLFAFSPVDDPRLAEMRPTLSKTVLEQGIRLGSTGFAAHPSCRDMAALFAAGELAFAPCAGTTDSSRSHFQAQDLFEIGSGGSHGDTGFMARSAAVLGGRAGAISFTREVPLSFHGADSTVEVAPLSGSALKLPQGRMLEAIRLAHQGQRTGEALDQALATQTEIEAAMNEPMTGMEPGASRGADPAGGFARQAQQMGRMLRANPRLSLAFLDLGGWDTHAGQEGILTRALDPLGAGLVALKDALGSAEWRRTRIVVMSEFGRTVRENGTRGTDHGHGGLALLAGGAIRGGRMLGDFRGLDERDLNQNRDLPVLTDWRMLLAACLRESYGLDERALAGIFPGMPKGRLDV
ncbi:MAG: DUF1501 domain-containing protein [bacterium]|nr:DUF1501 domain-containing protein [bacterium]